MPVRGSPETVVSALQQRSLVAYLWHLEYGGEARASSFPKVRFVLGGVLPPGFRCFLDVSGLGTFVPSR